MKTYICVFLFSLISLCHGIVNNTIVLGMSISLTPPSSSRAQLGVRVNDGMTFYLETIDRTVVINNTTYEIDIRTIDDQSNATLCVENYQKFMADPEVDFLLAPINSDWSQMIRAITEPAGRVLVSATAASDSFYSGASYAFSILTPSKELFTSTLPSLRFLGVKSVAYISETQPFAFAACNTLEGLAKDVGISMLGGNSDKPLIPPASYNLTDEQKQNISDALDLIQKLNPDYMIICAFPPNAFEIVRQAKARNYSPKGIFVTPMLVEWESFEDNEYISGNEQWISTANYPADSYFGNSLDYTNAYNERFGYVPDGFSAMGSVSPLLYQEAIKAAKSVDQDNVQFALSRTALDLFFGTITYAVDNACLKEAIDMQIHNSSRVPVGPPRAQLASIIYPIPTWDERVYKPVWLDNPAEIAITVLTGIVMLFVVSLMIVVVYLRKHRVVKAASPVFLEFVLVGCLFLLSSNFAWTLHANDSSCGVIPWLIGTGFVLMFGSLYAKTWRIYKIFYSSLKNIMTNKRVISNDRLFIFIGIFLAIEFILLTIWTAVDPLREAIVVVDPYRPSLNYSVCTTGTAGYVMLALLAFFKVCLLIAGAYVSYKIKNVEMSLYNDSKIIGFSIYNFCVFSIVIFVIVVFQAGTREVAFVLRSLLLLVGLGIIIGVLFIPKLHFVRINYSGGSVYSFFTNQKADVRKWQARSDALQNLLVKHNIDFSEIEVDEYIKQVHPDVWREQHPSTNETKSDGEVDLTVTKTDQSATDA